MSKRPVLTSPKRRSSRAPSHFAVAGACGRRRPENFSTKIRDDEWPKPLPPATGASCRCFRGRRIERSMRASRTPGARFPKWHKDSLNLRKAQLEGWLQDCGAGFDPMAIARAVYGRAKGLSRPTKAQA